MVCLVDKLGDFLQFVHCQEYTFCHATPLMTDDVTRPLFILYYLHCVLSSLTGFRHLETVHPQVCHDR